MHQIMKVAAIRQEEQRSLAEAMALTRLRDQLVRCGVKAALRDNDSALMVSPPEPALPVWVFIGYGGACYSWQSAQKQHPVVDPQGAARLLVEYINR